MHEKTERVVKICVVRKPRNEYPTIIGTEREPNERHIDSMVTSSTKIGSEIIKYRVSDATQSSNWYPKRLKQADCVIVLIEPDFNFMEVEERLSRVNELKKDEAIILVALDKSCSDAQFELVQKVGRAMGCISYIQGVEGDACHQFAARQAIYNQKRVVDKSKVVIDDNVKKETARKQDLLKSALGAKEHIRQLLCTTLERELKAFLKRRDIRENKGESIDELKLTDKSRYNVVQSLLKTINDITDNTKITMDNIDTWKQAYQKELKKAVTHSLNDARLDKYNSYEKWGIALLNLITVLFSPIKKWTTGSYFFSLTGKPKEVVEEVKDIIDNSQAFKYL